MKMTSRVLAISLVAVLSACGKQESAAPEASVPPVSEAAVPPAAVPSAQLATADPAHGKSVFNKTCALCHAIGAAGAPKPGDQADWAPRIAQGVDVLYTHAIDGFTGAKGVMPARGGASALSDDDVKAAVDYMVAQSQS